jgi:hypothetical protein
MNFSIQALEAPNTPLVVIARGASVQELATLAESYFHKNTCTTVRVFDHGLNAIAQVRREGGGTYEAVWTKPTTAIGTSSPMEPGTHQAVSFNHRTGLYLTTNHTSRARALKRLRGNARHGEHHIIRWDLNDQGQLVTFRETVQL